MKNKWEEIVSEEMPKDLEDRIVESSRTMLAQRRAEHSRERPFFSRLSFLKVGALGLSSAGLVIAVVVLTKNEKEKSLELAQGQSNWEMIEDSEVIAEMDFLQDLSVLEKLEDSETWQKLKKKKT